MTTSDEERIDEFIAVFGKFYDSIPQPATIDSTIEELYGFNHAIRYDLAWKMTSLFLKMKYGESFPTEKW